jgi:hypothetical protein
MTTGSLMPQMMPHRSAATLGKHIADDVFIIKGGLKGLGRFAAALKAFVNEGGTLLAFNEASEYAIETMALPVSFSGRRHRVRLRS